MAILIKKERPSLRSLLDISDSVEKVYIKTDSEKEYKEAQELLFKFGYKWTVHGRQVQNKGVKHPYLVCITKDKELRVSSRRSSSTYTYVSRNWKGVKQKLEVNSQPKHKLNTKSNVKVFNIPAEKVTILRGERPEGKCLSSKAVRASIKIGFEQNRVRALKA